MSKAPDKEKTTIFLNGELPTTVVRKIQFFGRAGKPLSEEEYHRVMHYAKVVHPIEQGSTQTYYVRVFQGTLFDPMGPYGKRQRDLETQMRKVSKGTFDFYITYLMTNNSIYLTRAQRGLLND